MAISGISIWQAIAKEKLPRFKIASIGCKERISEKIKNIPINILEKKICVLLFIFFTKNLFNISRLTIALELR